MNIALVCRDYGLPRSSPVAAAVGSIGGDLVRAGHSVRIIAQSAPQLPSYEARGRLTIHRVALPAPVVSWTRILLDFAVEAGRIVCELHRVGEIDVAEFPDRESPAAGIALLGRRDALRPPFVVAVHEEGAPDAARRGNGASFVPMRLGLTVADGVLRADCSADERERSYRTVIDRWRKGVGALRAPDGLDAWRRVARSLGVAAGVSRLGQESIA